MTLDAALFPDVSSERSGSPPTEIECLLAPLAPDAFLARYWAREPVHLTGRPARFADLFDKPRFTAAIERAQARGTAPDFSINRFTQDFDGVWTCSEAIDLAEVEPLVAAGGTVCVRNIAAGDDTLVAFGRRVAKALGLVGSVGFNAYYSGHGSGADLHFDRSITCALQLEGRKRWRFAPRPTLAWPPGNGRLQADGTPIYAAPWFGARGWDTLDASAIELREVVLEPGDLLVLPAGTWHAARAIGGSLALNMLFSPFPFDSVLQQAMRAMFEPHESWRGGIPAGADVAACLDARLAELRGALDSGGLRAALLDFHRGILD